MQNGTNQSYNSIEKPMRKDHNIEDYVDDNPSFNSTGRTRRGYATAISSKVVPKTSGFNVADRETYSPSFPSAFHQLDLLSRPSGSTRNNATARAQINPQSTAFNQADRYIDSLFSSNEEDMNCSPSSDKDLHVRKGVLDSPTQGHNRLNSPISTLNHSGIRKTSSGNKVADVPQFESDPHETKVSTSAKNSMVDILVNAFSRLFSASPIRQAKKNDSFHRDPEGANWVRSLSDKSKSFALPLGSSSDFFSSFRWYQQHKIPKEKMLFLLVCISLIMYIIIQLSSRINLDRKVAPRVQKSNNLNSGFLGRVTKLHEEGLDRPNSVEYLRMIQKQRLAPQRVVGGVQSMSSLGSFATEGDGISREQLQEKEHHEQNLNRLYRQSSDSSLPAKISIAAYNNIATVDAMRVKGEIPLFWHIPRGGGGSYKEIFGQCMGLSLGCELGGDPHHADDTGLKLFDVGGKRVVNVDMYKPQGIEKARKLELVSSDLIDVIVSPYLYQVSTLFSSNHKGRMFAVFRDPIERALSIHGFQEQLFMKENPGKAFMSLEEYAKSSKIENNWMTRFITNRMSGPLNPDDLQSAKSILKSKCLIGLLDRREESLERFNKYFGWMPLKVDPRQAELRRQCIQKNLEGAPSHRKFSSQIVEKGSNTYTLLAAQNVYDIELYLFAKELFDAQSSLFS